MDKSKWQKEKSEQPRNDNVAQTTKEERTSIKQTYDYKQTPLSISRKYSMTRTTT